MQNTPVRAAACAAAALALVTLPGCGVIGSGSGDSEAAEMSISSQYFTDLKDLPVRYACSAYRGLGKTPPLHWSGYSDAKAFAIVVDDPDARGGTYIHLVLTNLDGTTLDMVEGSFPPKAIVGENSAKQRGYEAPCPPQGQRHRYRYTVYALKEAIPAEDAVELKKSLPAIASRTIARGRITGYLGQSKGS